MQILTPEHRRQIRKLISSDSVIDAIESLLDLQLSERIINQVIMHKRALINIGKQLELGLISQNDARVARNNVAYALLELLDDVDRPLTEVKEVNSKAPFLSSGNNRVQDFFSFKHFASILLGASLTYVLVDNLHLFKLPFQRFEAFNQYTPYAFLLVVLVIAVSWYFSSRRFIKGGNKDRGQGHLNRNLKNYLESLVGDLDSKNFNVNNNKFYIETEGVLMDAKMLKTGYEDFPKVKQYFYTVTGLKDNVKEQDFNNLSNLEKIDSSRGRSFNRLEDAITVSKERSNVCVIIAPPGSGKTVSLRNLAVTEAKRKLTGRTNVIPVFINLGFYVKKVNGKVQSFEDFLEDYFQTIKYYNHLANSVWKTYIRKGELAFFLDSIDEMPRKPGEYERRCEIIRQFTDHYPNIQFVLTCRELDYNKELPFQQILIKPFNKEQIRKYLREYFGRTEGKKYFRQIVEQENIFSISTNPFYLNLVAQYINHNGAIPKNKASLFEEFTTYTVKREIQKEHLKPERKDLFQDHIMDLAYHMAINLMKTTISVEEILDSRTTDRELYQESIVIGVKSGLLVYIETTGDIRFIHNRFLEYYSSQYIFQNYTNPDFSFPDNFLTNIWWRETILLIASLEGDIDRFVGKLLPDVKALDEALSYLNFFLKLRGFLLLFECINVSPSDSEKSTYYQELYDILLQYFKDGNTLTKAKILSAIEKDNSKVAIGILKLALNDKSNWVSERAFYILSEGDFKLQMNIDNILNEYWRFFTEGRTASVLWPLLKRAVKSPKIALTLPLFFILLAVNLLSLVFILYTVGYYFDHIIYRLNSSFTRECIRCIFTSLLFIGTIVYFFLKKREYPVLTRLFYLSPLVFAQYIMFTASFKPDNFTHYTVILGAAVVAVLVYNQVLRKPKESDFSLFQVTAAFLGNALGVYLLSVTDFDFTPIVNSISEALPFTGDATVTEPVNPDSTVQDTTSQTEGDAANKRLTNSPFSSFEDLMVFIAFPILIVIAGSRVVHQVRLSFKTKQIKNELGALLKKSVLFPKDLAEQVYLKLEDVQFIWTKKILLSHFLNQLNQKEDTSREFKIYFLVNLANLCTETNLKDAVYQLLEEEENNFSRTIEDRNYELNYYGEPSWRETFVLAGNWEMQEDYDGGSTQITITIADDEKTGIFRIKDFPAEGEYFEIEELVEIERGEAGEVVFSGTAVELISGEINDYNLDIWKGIITSEDLIVGESTDDSGTEGQFTMRRTSI